MRINVWPACIECSFIKLEEGTCYSSKRDCFGDMRPVSIDVIECIHVPVCSRINGQEKIEGGNECRHMEFVKE